MTPAETSSSQSLDLSNCEREPIHIPGSIQPHGLLLALRQIDWTIAHISNNCQELIGFEPQDLLNQRLNILFTRSELDYLTSILSEDIRPGSPVYISTVINGKLGQVFCEGGFHRANGLLLLELVPQARDSVAGSRVGISFELARQSIGRLERTVSLAELNEVTAREVRKLTGFDRVMIYRFDEGWNGEVIAEDKPGEMESYLGLHFPASDIPAQARALYVLNPVRLISDVNYQPAPIMPPLDRVTGQPVDLSYAFLRSVSPLHIEYLINMRVGASMSISILKDGKLWGMVACHHRTARYISYEMLTACQFLTRIMASRLAEKEALEFYDFKVRLREQLVFFIKAMAEQVRLPGVLTGRQPSINDYIESGGAALYMEDEWWLVGHTPGEQDLKLLVEWLKLKTNDPIFFTNNLSGLYPEAERFRDVASGLLAAAISPEQDEYVLWFRPEIIQSVKWSGNPDKRVESSEQGMRLHPRKSFALWEEQVRFKSLPWQPYELQAASDLREAILVAALRQAAQSLKELKTVRLLSAGISHDFNNLLAGILMSSELALLDFEPDTQPYRAMETIAENVQKAAELVRQLAEFSGKADSFKKLSDLNSLVEEQIALTRHNLADNISLDFQPDAGLPWLQLDQIQLRKVINSLVKNALEAIGEGAEGHIIVTTGQQQTSRKYLSDALVGNDQPAGHYLYLEVADNGSGIAPADLSNIFNPFFSTKFVGRGMSLAAVAGIVRAHYGTIKVESQPGVGSRFKVLLSEDKPA